MKQLGVWLGSALFFAAAGGAAVWLFERSTEVDHDEPAATAPAVAEVKEPTVARDESGAPVVRMSEEKQQRVGLRVETVRSANRQPTWIAYGTIQEDPAETFILRAPLAGTVVTSAAGTWPGLGRRVAEGTQVGGLEPRLGPVERADLLARLATARGDVEDARALLVASRASLESKRQLNTEGKIIADQVLQEAAAKVAGESARLRAAEETVGTLEASVAAAVRPEDALPLVVAQSGRVVEILARPGESVEGGQALLRISRLDRLLARVSLPVGDTVNEVTSAAVLLPGQKQAIAASAPVPAPSVDPITGGQTFLLPMETQDLEVQPGGPVTAELSRAGSAIAGVLVPPGAIVRYVGADWVYVQSAEETFTRVGLAGIHPIQNGVFIEGGLEPGTPVVVTGAQSLLSEELKFQQAGGEEEEE